ncbi:MAG: hypothetical protein WAL56_12020 [Candidatus Sulfotelmatobacter sp.]
MQKSDHADDENPPCHSACVLHLRIEDLFMTAGDEKDYQRFLEGIEFFLKLDVKQHMEHIKQHKEDALCTIRHFSGTGSAFCTSDGMPVPGDGGLLSLPISCATSAKKPQRFF